MGRAGALRDQEALDLLELELNGCKLPHMGVLGANLRVL